jgi:hypothetical protein
VLLGQDSDTYLIDSADPDLPQAYPRCRADGLHARTDGFTSLAVVIGGHRRAGRSG